MQDHRAGHEMVNMDDYFIGVLSQFKDDSEVLNPMNIAIQSNDTPGEPTTNTEEVLTRLAERVAAKNAVVDIAIPIAHSAIDDTRVFFDTLVLQQAYTGYPSGEIPIQFNAFNGLSSPDRVVKITIPSFNFPHIYLPSSVVFDVMYFRSVFMTFTFVPLTNAVQVQPPNNMFTFELYVDRIDSNSVYLIPLEPTFILKQPITISGDANIRFQVRDPRGGMVACQIPPTRVTVRRQAWPLALTTFIIVDGTDINVLAPYGVLYTVPITFLPFSPTAWPLGQALSESTTGFQASNFRPIVTPGGTFPGFDIPFATWGVPPAPPGMEDRLYIFIPKNAISFTFRLSCLQSTKTNDLIPIHM
jgi:hypothetical protein